MTKRGRQQGELEQLILDALWDSASAVSSQQLLDLISPDGELALTTVLTVLSRLADKGLVIREAGQGRSLLFRAAQSREQHTAELMLKIVAGAGNPALAFSHFAQGLSESDLAALRKTLG
ncbi:MAG: BlaI/MecI/CopY family transcriptional regulator [Rhodoluna sp.]